MHKYLRDEAWKFIIEQNIISLPIDSLEIACKNNWICYSYTQLSERMGKSTELIEKYDKDGFAFWSKAKNGFIVAYNDALPQNICNWTVMHEIAHIHLKHITPSTPILKRVRPPQSGLFEYEAQGFARRVLCPSIVLHNCKIKTVEELMLLCNISLTAAEYRLQYLKELQQRNMFSIHPLERQVEKQFQLFINTYTKNK